MNKIWQVTKLFALAVLILQMSCKDSGTGPYDMDRLLPPPAQTGEWDLVGLEGDGVTAIAIVPQKPWIIFAGTSFDYSAGTRGKIFRSNDWGRTWKEVLRNVSVERIFVDPKNPSIVYAGLGGCMSSTTPCVIKSTDGGDSWSRADSGISITLLNSLTCLEIDPHNTNTLYAGEAGLNGGALWKTTNGGRSWFIPDEQLSPLRNGVTALAIDPTNTNIIYAATNWIDGIFKSTDTGLTWRMILPSTGSIVYCLAADKTKNVYAGLGSYGLIYSKDGGETWMKPSSGLPDTLTVAQIKLYNSSTLFLSGNWVDNGGVYRSTDGGISWMYIGIDSGRVGALEVDRENNFLYVAKGGIYRWRIKPN